MKGAAVAHWIRLSIPLCGPRFESQAHHLRLFHSRILYYVCHCVEKRTKIKQKEAVIGPYLKK